MTTLPQQNTIVQYTGNSSQTAYTFPFYAPLNTDIAVYLQPAGATPDPVADLQVLGVNYTVAFNLDPTTGGTINFNSAPATGAIITIARAVQTTLTTNFAAVQNFNGANLDAALLRLLLMIQQGQSYNLERNLSYVINSFLPNPTAMTQLPVLGNGQSWVGTGSGVVAAVISGSESAAALQAALANNASGNDGARMVGYYDVVGNSPTTVQAFLANIIPFINAHFAPTPYVFNGARAYMSTTQNITPNLNTLLLFDTVDFDPNSLFVLADNGFKIVTRGYYLVTANVYVTNSSLTGNVLLGLSQNGASVRLLAGQVFNNANLVLSGNAIIHASPNDVLTLVMNNQSATTAMAGEVGNAAIYTNFAIQFIGT